MTDTIFPQKILPPTVAWGKTDKDGRVMIDKNWWLFLQNVAASSGVGAATLSNTALQQLFGSDEFLNDPGVSPALGDLLPQDLVQPNPFNAAFLIDSIPDAVSRAQPESAITVGASPFTYTAPFDGWVIVSGGTVSDISLLRKTTFYTTGETAGVFPVARLDQLKVTWTGSPTMTFFPR